MTYTFDGQNFVVDNNGSVVIFKCGADNVEPIENEDGSLTWPTINDAAQANRNRVSEALIDPINATRFAELLIANASTAYTIFLTEIP
jgi:hypothetical protein